MQPRGGHTTNSTFVPGGTRGSVESASEKVPWGYRFAFNGMEKDDEMHNATGTSYDFGARLYDPRIGRWLSIDPLYKQYPSNSSYIFALDNPIFFVDHDGKEVVAFDPASQQLVIAVVNYLFGGGHGFAFENNKLVHGAEPPANLNDAQSLMYKYFVETLVESRTVVEMKANQSQLVDFPPHARSDPDAHPMLIPAPAGGGVTIDLPPSTDYTESGLIFDRRDRKQVILIHPGAMGGTATGTTAGVKPISAAHVGAHEFAHAMVNVIMSEFGGQFNGVDFNEMSQTQRDDWAIQYTNTLWSSQGKALEDGSGQHGRSKNEVPAAGVPPLKE